MNSEGKDTKEPCFTQNNYQSDDQIVIALDFGTTFSGIAYAYAIKDKPEIVTILDWPGLEGHRQPKVPTVICYDPENASGFTWGAQNHKREVIRGMKLLLDPAQNMPVYLPASGTNNDLKVLGKSALDIAADFIGAIYKHAMTVIEGEIPKEYLDMCQKQFVLSVPAVWSDKAKDLTLKAAKRAKIHPVTLIKEPEAAALYTLQTLKDQALAVGDAFIICDAGGGTVDLISYEITQLTPKLDLKELVPGKGGMAGSLGLNRRFEEAVKELVGEDQFYALRRTRGFAHAVEHDDLKKIFDPLITDIERLVDEQVNLVKVKRMSEDHPKATEIKGIFLVGGFGSSGYLKSRIGACHPTIQIIQPHDAWSAIVRGAVLSGLPRKTGGISIISTQSTRHYGVVGRSLYDEEKDRGRPKTVDCYGDTRTSTMTWYIHRGEDLGRDQKLKFPFYRTIEGAITNSALIFREHLLQCESTAAPVYPGITIKQNCILTADLSGVDRSTFKQRTSVRGTPCWDVHYDLVVTVSSAVMKFSLEIKGKEIGSVEAKYD
ncbi:putative hsp70 protein [Botrytis cinerea BcDW1]|uniref:Putative hsp70 protein n=1 Tax=Botryotinia fuckeliana (strain BcDW1) TaxID=1290391 RepID=M7TED1_BOTF1|nr:putative hsp70 protein [Botrytis cinerea BcDW1]